MVEGEVYKVYIVDETEHGDTLQELFERATNNNKHLSFNYLSPVAAWSKFIVEHQPANAILVHGSVEEGKITGIKLLQELVRVGYPCTVFSVGGARKTELGQYEKESGVSGLTDADLHVILELLKIVSQQ